MKTIYDAIAGRGSGPTGPIAGVQVVCKRADGRTLICETVTWPGGRESFRVSNGSERLCLTTTEAARLASVLFTLAGRE